LRSIKGIVAISCPPWIHQFRYQAGRNDHRPRHVWFKTPFSAPEQMINVIGILACYSLIVVLILPDNFGMPDDDAGDA
jgi:hypothetical protein